MDDQFIFNFKTDISQIAIPEELNNPFRSSVPEIARIAAEEFQEFIALESLNWNYDFSSRKGKMFGILVIRLKNKDYNYLGTVSGDLPEKAHCDRFIPSIFDKSTDDFFINKGMSHLTEIGTQIQNSSNTAEIDSLKEERRQKSIALQQRLFENYNFLNISGKKKNLIEIFKNSPHGNPPAAAGECTAPKLLQYALSKGLKPIAIAEFWWGGPIKTKERKHGSFYPACKDRCRPILEYMLEDNGLFEGHEWS